MPMKMGWRWYGEGNDPITLNDIKQIPGVTSIVWALHNKMPGEIWEIDEIQKVADQIHAYGFDMDVVESVNVHDDIKIGLPTRDKYIENYKQCIRNLSKFGVKVICYNFMPIFDWTRTDLFHPVGDGSTALFYQKDMIQDDYKAMADYILGFTEKYNMTFPGWEPERMAKLDELFKAYAPVTKEKLWENLKYFLEALMPTCRECDIKMAIHMDDPPWDIFGLPRLLVDEPSIDRFLKMVDDPYNCLTLCTGSLNANPNNNCAEIIRKHCDQSLSAFPGYSFQKLLGKFYIQMMIFGIFGKTSCCFRMAIRIRNIWFNIENRCSIHQICTFYIKYRAVRLIQSYFLKLHTG